MLQDKIWTQEEIDRYMADLKSWLREEREKPVEEMDAFFARRVGIYDGVHLEHWGEEYAHFADYFDDGLHTLLDLGCGTGLELEAIFRRFPEGEVTGIDLSAVMLQKLREKYRGQKIRTIAADYFTEPFDRDQYDAAMSFETFHHFPAQKKQLFYDKLFRAVKPGGSYLSCDYVACCEEEEALCLEQWQYKRKKWNVPDDTFIHIDIPLTLAHERELLTNAGFLSVRALYQNGSTVILRADRA